MGTITYIKNFLKDRYVASITPTSRSGVRTICEKIDFEKARLFVEYGPGTGVITQQLLEKMHPEAELLLIERNPNFVSILQQSFPDSRVTIYHEDAKNVRRVIQSHGAEAADYVISGIPFSWLSEQLRDHIIRESFQVLRSGGKFIAYQMFWQANEHLRDYLSSYFGDVHTEIELISAPPLRIYEASKNGTAAVHKRNGNGKAPV